MKVELDVRVLELVCSRLCHELVSPVGAINNGVELIEETAGVSGTGMGDAVALIGASAEQAARRLRLLRLAYGAAGTVAGTAAMEFRTTADQYFQGGRVTLDWPAGTGDDALSQPGLGKLMLNLLILAEEALPYGGRIRVGGDAVPALVAEGRGVALRPEVVAALTDTIAIAADGLTPRSIHGFITRCFAARADFRVVVTPVSAARMAFALVR